VIDSWHLRIPDWLDELSAQEVERLRSQSSQSDYARGSTIFTPRTNPHSIYLLEQGLVRIYRLSQHGEETTFGYVSPGEVFGELTVFGDFPRESFAMTVHASRVWRIPLKVFHDLLESHTGVLLAIIRQMGQRMKRIESRVENLVFRDVRARLAGILLELKEDFGHPRGDSWLLDLALTQAELATLVGATRQTVNASLRELESRGLIRREGRRLIVCRPAELASVAGPGAKA
jgi:CRP-like cAMP-binding protein